MNTGRRQAPARWSPELWNYVAIGNLDECWPWVASTGADGYGSIARKYPPYRQLAHRLIYELVNGPIPDEMVVDHHCHNLDPSCPAGADCKHRRCCNPEHLQLATRGENVRLGKARIQACPHGHDYDEVNTLVTQRGHRVCRTCAREAMRRKR